MKCRKIEAKDVIITFDRICPNCGMNNGPQETDLREILVTGVPACRECGEVLDDVGYTLMEE